MKYNSKFQEQIILSKLKKAEPEAFNDLYNYYIDRIYRFVYFKVPTVEEAEDLTSEVFLKTWQYLLNENREIKNLQALLYQIARNLVVDFYRKKSHADFINDSDILSQIEDSRQQSLLSKIDKNVDIIRIEKVLKTLKDEYKEVVILHYIEELSVKEISNILNKSRGAVRVLIHRALTIIRGQIN